MGRINPISSRGSPTALSTINMVTRPASGMPAAPIAASVAVTAMTICLSNVNTNVGSTMA